MAGVRQYGALTLLAAKTYNANTNGNAVDLQNYVAPGSREMKAVLSVGSQSGTNPTLDVKVQDSADGSTGWADIPGAAFAQVGGALSEQTIHCQTLKRYVRAVVTVGGTSPVYGVYCGLMALDRNV